MYQHRSKNVKRKAKVGIWPTVYLLHRRALARKAETVGLDPAALLDIRLGLLDELVGVLVGVLLDPLGGGIGSSTTFRRG